MSPTPNVPQARAYIPSMSTGGPEEEEFGDLPIYGFVIFGALLLSLVGSYIVTLCLFGLPRIGSPTSRIEPPMFKIEPPMYGRLK